MRSARSRNLPRTPRTFTREYAELSSGRTKRVTTGTTGGVMTTVDPIDVTDRSNVSTLSKSTGGLPRWIFERYQKMAGRKKHTTAAPVRYERPKKPDPVPGKSYDIDTAEQMLIDSLERNGNHRKPKGTCYDCGKRIPPMRILCGRCLSSNPQGGRDG